MASKIPMPPLVRKHLKQQLAAVCVEGGKKRWEGVPPEERSRLMKLASKKAAALRTRKKSEKR